MAVIGKLHAPPFAAKERDAKLLLQVANILTHLPRCKKYSGLANEVISLPFRLGLPLVLAEFDDDEFEKFPVVIFTSPHFFALMKIQSNFADRSHFDKLLSKKLKMW